MLADVSHLFDFCVLELDFLSHPSAVAQRRAVRLKAQIGAAELGSFCGCNEMSAPYRRDRGHFFATKVDGA